MSKQRFPRLAFGKHLQSTDLFFVSTGIYYFLFLNFSVIQLTRILKKNWDQMEIESFFSQIEFNDALQQQLKLRKKIIWSERLGSKNFLKSLAFLYEINCNFYLRTFFSSQK